MEVFPSSTSSWKKVKLTGSSSEALTKEGFIGVEVLKDYKLVKQKKRAASVSF